MYVSSHRRAPRRSQRDKNSKNRQDVQKWDTQYACNTLHLKRSHLLHLLALETIEHLVAVLEIGTARTLEGAFVVMDVAAMLVAVELFRKANAADVTVKLAHFRVDAALVLDEMVLAFELEGAQLARELAHFLVHRALMFVEV